MDPISEAVWPYFVTLFVGIIFISIFLEKKRVTKLESTAKELGFEFSASGRSTTLSDHENFDLFHKGQNRRVRKELWGSINGNDFRFFVFSYCESGGNNNTRNTTVLSIKCDKLDAPTFSLQPKLKRMMMVPDFGQYHPGIEISPTLSESYVVKGSDEEKIRNFFRPRIISFFEANPDFHLEAQKDSLILYSSSRTSRDSDIKKLYQLGQELLSIFT